MEFILSTVLLFAGLAAAVAIIGVNSLIISSSPKRAKPTIYIAVAAVYSAVLIFTLIKQSGGIACTIPSAKDLILYAVMLALELFFLYDSLVKYREE